MPKPLDIHMGIAQAGIVFRVADPIDDLAGVMSSLFGERATEIALPLPRDFDIRNRADAMVQLFGDVCFISNDALVHGLLHDHGASVQRLHSLVGAPALLVAFCHYEDAGRHGYAVFENGSRVRTRLQTCDAAGAVGIAESGAPLPFERRWLQAAHFVEEPALALAGDAPRKVHYLGEREVLVPARELTARMLQDGLEALYRVCPWETLITPTYRFYRLGAEPPAAAASAAAAGEAAPPPAPRRPWWRLL